MRDQGDGHARVVDVGSGKCLDVNGGSSATADGTRVVQWTCHGGTNQQWRFEDARGGHVRLVARHSGKCPDVLRASTTDGAQLVQWTCGGGTDQQWLRRDAWVALRSWRGRASAAGVSAGVRWWVAGSP
ncbi:RICIN domain-containing protein [Saccharothrix longispora]|uniref:Ricin B lectin domain-containing protein n=1 Tax=Saccharothrix longispora TaxID=33920 RepID=A0ABU1PTU5_9PSEU|nr:RICIN domain-containing protein [Saccharothrix longispora]MDR6594049.1 hypothetical protein [Saccharothrix longispora]